ncbi:MAG: PilZ domain-containing protein, partial [Planctomycetes bacterium]|nr:PilZ domain-containing protein [Planctomycetota bacterium]
MANVLIVDLREESAYLVRSLLRGKGHASSIAISLPEARAKLETGLFDTLFVDLCEASQEAISIAAYANELLPGLPVVALCHNKTVDQIDGIDLFAKVMRPIKGAEITSKVERAIKHVLNLGVRRESPRVNVSVPIEINFGDDSFQARISDLSDRGFAIDADEEVLTQERLDRIVEGMAMNNLEGTAKLGRKEEVSLKGRIAFVDRA